MQSELLPHKAPETLDPELFAELNRQIDARNAAGGRAYNTTIELVDTFFIKCIGNIVNPADSNASPENKKVGYELTWRDVLAIIDGLGVSHNSDPEIIYEWLQIRLDLLKAERPESCPPSIQVQYLNPTSHTVDAEVFRIVAM